MRVSGRDIICLSTHYWDDHWFRKQQFMSRFAECNRVLYVEPTFSMARKPGPHHQSFASNRFFRPTLVERDANLTLLKPPRAIPKPHHPHFERLNYRWFGRLVGEAAKRLGFCDPVLWVYRPAYWHGLGGIPHEHLVLDLVDDLASYSGAHVHNVEASLTGIAESSDLTVVTARVLEERYRSRAKRLVRIPNGFDAGLFNDRVEPAVELSEISRPIIGFVGTLFEYIDYRLLHEAAIAHEDKAFVLVGRVDPACANAVARLRELGNVWHLGPRPRQEIPSLLAAFDVCLCPFASSAVADSVSPLKVYEYLAMGKPVVSTPMASLEAEPISTAIRFTDGGAEFAAAIGAALASDRPDRAAARRRAVAPYSWDSLFDRLDERLEAAIA